MSQHESLKERKLQHKSKVIESKEDDKIMFEASKCVCEILKNKYPKYEFKVNKKLYFHELFKFIGRGNCTDPNRGITPDGGIIWMDNLPIFLGEAKRQGTWEEKNIHNTKETLNKHCCGNAIERMSKNIVVAEVLFEKESILPYLCVCWGCDFGTEYIITKLESMNKFIPINTLYTDISNFNHKPISLMTRIDRRWTKEEIINLTLTICEFAIKYYQQKYHI